jgi:hypothetical protein
MAPPVFRSVACSSRSFGAESLDEIHMRCGRVFRCVNLERIQGPLSGLITLLACACAVRMAGERSAGRLRSDCACRKAGQERLQHSLELGLATEPFLQGCQGGQGRIQRRIERR